MSAWDHWFHCTTHTYGTWLCGDPRGWRARHHREHVDGDYKNPPPKGKYVTLHQLSKSLMKRDPVRIKKDLCQFVLDRVIERLLTRDSEVARGCFDGVHLHVLVRCYEHNPKVALGSAKQFATAQLKAQGFALGIDLENGDEIWQVGSRAEPIVNQNHFTKTQNYIEDHAERGAVIWRPRVLVETFPEVDLLL
jgi:hypothetical protein